MSRVAEAMASALPVEAVEGRDPAGWSTGGAVPEAVVAPATADEVRQVLALAAAEGVGVIPMGGGTDPGPEAPAGPFLALSTERITGVEEYGPADLTVTVRAGTPLATLAAALAAEGQWLPVDPPFAPRRTVGGVVATGSAGPLGMAYGTPRDHVLGLTVVTGDGRVLRLGGKVMKNVAGFDLVKLVVGSRGTLGVIVSVCFRLFPRPAEERVLVATAASPGRLVELARQVASAPVVPASAVLVSRFPSHPGEESALVVRVQGTGPTVEADAGRLLPPSGTPVRVLGGSEAAAFLAAIRDHAAGHGLTVRCSALPGLLGDVLSAAEQALPGAAFAADVMSGRVRAAVGDVAAADPSELLRLRQRLQALGGSMVLERAPAAVLDQVPVSGRSGRVRALEDEIRARFDPGGVLSPGRFVS
jgi:glycolate oxidase FAD binding subunit